MNETDSPARQERNLFESKTWGFRKEDLRTDEFCANRAFGESETFIENPCEENMSTTHPLPHARGA